jgi:mono/diheme cytochrome c family protein
MKRLLFVLFTAALAVLFFVALGQDMNREWTSYQRQFLKSLERGERRGVTGGIKQIQATELRRVDRCITCHVAIDRPQLALAEEPFTAHPGQYLTWHPPEKFGCTVCHGGQGLATEVKAAHGQVKHWEQPLLTGPYVQASCYKCHGDVQSIREHVPQLAQGIALYEQLGCAGCHTINGFGQTVSVDLSDIGDKPLQLLDFTFVGGGHGGGHSSDHELRQWIYEHFLEPRNVTPGFRKDELPPGEEEVYPTFMPNYGLSEEEAHALTIYMLSLTAEQLPAKYVRPARGTPPPTYTSAVEQGKAVFQKYGCVGCHGQDGRGGRKNFNAQWGQEVPSLVQVANYYDRHSLKQLIETGRQPVPRIDQSRPRPPFFMPAWKSRIPDGELDALVEYLMTLREHVLSDGSEPAPAPPAAPPVTPSTPEPSATPPPEPAATPPAAAENAAP